MPADERLSRIEECIDNLRDTVKEGFHSINERVDNLAVTIDTKAFAAAQTALDKQELKVLRDAKHDSHKRRWDLAKSIIVALIVAALGGMAHAAWASIQQPKTVITR